MGEIMNLNKARKARARAVEAAQAAANRIRHGRTPAERANDLRAEARRQALLDGARRAASGTGAADPSGDPASPEPMPSPDDGPPRAP
jgi:Xaa-Pro aminopeptidase